jgi:hypothetical protein
MAEITQQASESLDLINSRQGDRGAGRNMRSDLIQSRVKVLCGRPVKPQRDVLCYALELLSCRAACSRQDLIRCAVSLDELGGDPSAIADLMAVAARPLADHAGAHLGALVTTPDALLRP